LQAQVDTGSITGTVHDASGAVVSGARVTMTNEGTGATLTTTTGSDGIYNFSPVRIGSYKLDVSAANFKTEIQTHVAVDVSARVLANFKLQPGAVSETVEVTTSAPVLQSEDASVGQVVNERSVNNLPLNGRNFTFLAQLAAGVNSPQATLAATPPAALSQPTATGRPRTIICWTASTTIPTPWTSSTGTNYVVLPPVDAIQEFKVSDLRFQRRVWPLGSCRAQCDHQVRHQSDSRFGLGVFP